MLSTSNSVKASSSTPFDWKRFASARNTCGRTSDPQPHGIRVYPRPFAVEILASCTLIFNSWSEADETELAESLKRLPCPFILSTWHSNEFPTNTLIERNWDDTRFHLLTREHYFHVGSTENLRHPIIEALITNFPVHAAQEAAPEVEQLAFYEKPLAEYSARGT